MYTMTKPRKRPGPPPDPNSKRSKKVDRHVTPRVVIHIPEDLLAEIEKDAAAEDRTRTAQILRLLKQHYQEEGRWHPPESEE